jgi:PLP dependent protein
MTMAPFTDDEAVVRGDVRGHARAAGAVRAEGVPLRAGAVDGDVGDYEIAIEEGSTMVRLGTVLFGERQ